MSCTTYNSHRLLSTTLDNNTSFSSTTRGGLELVPDPPSFGLLCVGYKYKLTISVFNSGKRPERLRVLCNQINSKVDTSLRTESLIHKEGKFTSKEECKLLKALKKRLTADGGSFVAMSRKFRSMDLDGNGVIDFEEFGLGMQALDLMLSEDKVKMLFRHFDLDGGGSIDIEEFIAGVREPIYEDKEPANKFACTYEPQRLAPGMRTSIDLEISAEVPGVAMCELRIMEASTQTEIVRTVKAYIVPTTNYKNVKKHMEYITANPELNILSEGVKGVGKVVLQHTDSRTVISSLDDDYNIDDDELDDIKNMPIVHGVYYDPWARKLKCDKELFKVVVNPSWTLQECMDEANANASERYFQLEQKGMFSIQTIEREEKVQKSRHNSFYNSVASTSEDQSQTDKSMIIGDEIDKNRLERSVSFAVESSIQEYSSFFET